MRLFETILEANHRAVAGERDSGVPLDRFAEALPVVALTCIDVRLNPLLPHVLGLPPEQFVWLRNAGNIITGPLSSTMRSLALACALKGGKEIAVIGHTDCKAGGVTTAGLTDAFRALGIARDQLPANLTEFFGLFASDRQNVIRGVDFVRASPLIGPKVPVHGLMLDVSNGQVDWVVNGYETLDSVASKFTNALRSAGNLMDQLAKVGELESGGLSSTSDAIGEKAAAPSAEGTPAVPPIAAESAPPKLGTMPTPTPGPVRVPVHPTTPPVLTLRKPQSPSPKSGLLKPWKRWL